MSSSTSQWVELQGVVAEIYDSTKTKLNDYSQATFNFQNTDRDVDVDLGIGSLGKMDAWTGQISKEDINKGYKTTYTQGKYSKAVDITQDLVQFNNYNRIYQKVKEVSKSFVKTMNYWSAYYFNNAWDSSVTGGNSAGVPLASASHRICPGDSTGSQSNTTNVVMNIDNIEDMRIAANGWKDDKGEVMDCMLDTIVCGTYWSKTVQQICGSEKEPYTGDNQINVYRKGASDELKYIINPYITGTKWALVNNMDMTDGSGLNWKWGRKPTTPELENNYTTHMATYSIWGWWTSGWNNWWFGYFSQGTV